MCPRIHTFIRICVAIFMCGTFLAQPFQTQPVFGSQSDKQTLQTQANEIYPKNTEKGNGDLEKNQTTNDINVELLAQIGGSCTHVAMQGNLAFYYEGHKVIILDISNPSSP